jgi:hypothetical protein
MIENFKNELKQNHDLFVKNNGFINPEQFEALVINTGCYMILTNFKGQIQQEHDLNYLHLSIHFNKISYQRYTKEMTKIALDLYPNLYDLESAGHAEIGIIQNISWASMYDFITVYFKDVLNKSIIPDEQKRISFESKFHERFEDGIKISEADIQRGIRIAFITDEKIVIEILPTLSPKTAKLTKITGNSRIYTGEDPDFVFEIFLNDDNSFKLLKFDRLDMDTFWKYY